MVGFDLPVTERPQRVSYRKFQGYLKKNGYFMLQRSIYVKLLHSNANADAEINEVEQNAPAEGSVAALQIGLAQFKRLKQFGESSFDISWFSDNIICI